MHEYAVWLELVHLPTEEWDAEEWIDTIYRETTASSEEDAIKAVLNEVNLGDWIKVIPFCKLHENRTYKFGFETMYTGMYDLDPTVREVTAKSFREAYDILVAENAYGDPYFRVVSVDGIPWDDAMFMPEYDL